MPTEALATLWMVSATPAPGIIARSLTVSGLTASVTRVQRVNIGQGLAGICQTNLIPKYRKILKGGLRGAFFIVRPAWARSWRCKSSRELTTANEVKRNCVRVTDRGEEAWSEAVSRWTRTGYEAVPSRASGQCTAKLLWSRLRRRKSGGCAVQDRVLTWGDLALCLKG
jgi:hypothetical protein